MQVRGALHTYEIRDLEQDLVRETDGYRLYLCKQEGEKRDLLMQVAIDVANNAALDRSAFFLQQLAKDAEALEAEYAIDHKGRLNYGLGFPEVVESFLLDAEQGGRRVNILAFRNVDDASRMKPLDNILTKDRRRVDPGTSAWIMGKALKTILFAHSRDYSVGLLDTVSILIEPGEHYVVLFDWSEAQAHADGVPADTCREDIKQAARSVIALMGGDHMTRTFPDGVASAYTDYLLLLAGGGQSSAKAAHKDFYALCDTIWERKFYPFTSHPLSTNE
jgi:hypothetical protein